MTIDISVNLDDSSITIGQSRVALDETLEAAEIRVLGMERIVTLFYAEQYSEECPLLDAECESVYRTICDLKLEDKIEVCSSNPECEDRKGVYLPSMSVYGQRDFLNGRIDSRG